MRKPTIILCNLIPGWLVLVEIMFSIKPADRLDIAVQSDCGTESGKKGSSLKFLCGMG
jgi:hypothetical protein